MRARNGLTGRSGVSEVIGGLSRAEGCWTFDARDQMPRPSRLTAYLAPKSTDRHASSNPARAGSFVGMSRHRGSIRATTETGRLRRLGGGSADVSYCAGFWMPAITRV